MKHLIIPNGSRKSFPAAIALALMISLAWPAAAATILVDTLEDNQGALDACSLRAAIINANNDDQSGSSNCQTGDGFDSITFDAGLADASIEMNGAALPTISDSLTIQGPVEDDADSLTIDARGLSRIVRLSDTEPVTLVINGITLTGGRTSADGPAEGGGGAIQGIAAKLEQPHVIVLNHARLTGNSTAGESASGGAILFVHGMLTLDDTEVSNNWTEGESAAGGAVGVGRDTSIAIFDSRIANNTVEAEFGTGGGIFGFSSSVEVTDSEIVGNSTQGFRGMGGGILLDAGGDLELTRSVLSDNATAGSFGSGGGAMVLGTVTLIESRVENNSTGGDTSLGGGLCLGLPFLTPRTTESSLTSGNSVLHGRGDIPLDEIRLTAIDSIVSGNSTAGSPAYGGGIALLERSAESGDLPAHLELEATTVANNTTFGEAAWGGGIAVLNSSVEGGTATLRNTTVSNNTAVGADSSGGGMVAALTDVSLSHATLAFNHADAGVDGIVLLETDNTDFDLVNSLIVQSGTHEEACSVAATASSNSLVTDPTCTGTAFEAGEIALQPLGDNGGFTPTHAPAASSLAINAAGDCVDGLDIDEDQRGQPRPGGQSINCDAGALERQNTEGNDTVFEDRFQSE